MTAAAVALAAALAGLPMVEAEGRVVRVVDGDTYQVRYCGELLKVRCLGVDCPEGIYRGHPAQPLAARAKAFARRMLLGKLVTLRPDPGAGDLDAYGRSLRHVMLGGLSASEALISAGLGRAYYTRGLSAAPADFCAAERAARTDKDGIWGLKKNPKPSMCPRSATTRGGRR